MKTIETFDGPNSFMSSFYPSDITIEGLTYPTVEHYYQASKADSIEGHWHIALMVNPHDVKAAGQRISLRPDWETVKFDIMVTGVTLKFFQNPHLREKLLATGDDFLIEGNHWGDRIWGATWDKASEAWVGENHLGWILMDVRRLINGNRRAS